jgi:glycosidase
MMNLLGSHDTLVCTKYVKGYSQTKMAVVFQMCFLGSPHIYYGDEIAMGGGRIPTIAGPLTGDTQKIPVQRVFGSFIAG